MVFCQVRKKSEPHDAIARDSVAINVHGAVQELPEIVPVEVPAILEFLDQTYRIERIPRLPELEHDKAADACLVERPRGERSEVVDVACLVALIAGADFLGKDFSEREADYLSRRERQEPEITLLDLRPALRWQRRCFAAADLQLDLAAALIPVMGVCRIHAPGKAVYSFVIAIVRNTELDSVLFSGKSFTRPIATLFSTRLPSDFRTVRKNRPKFHPDCVFLSLPNLVDVCVPFKVSPLGKPEA